MAALTSENVGTWLSTADVSHDLRVSTVAVRKMAHDGKLVCVSTRLGLLFDPESVAKAVEQRKTSQ